MVVFTIFAYLTYWVLAALLSLQLSSATFGTHGHSGGFVVFRITPYGSCLFIVCLPLDYRFRKGRLVSYLENPSARCHHTPWICALKLWHHVLCCVTLSRHFTLSFLILWTNAACFSRLQWLNEEVYKCLATARAYSIKWSRELRHLLMSKGIVYNCA